MSNYCPDCGNLINGSIHCKCGWIDIKGEKTDNQCCYTHDNKRCPLPGTISTNTHGGAPWYCSAHYLNINNKDLCNHILKHYLENGIPDYKDWRDVLVEQKRIGKI